MKKNNWHKIFNKSNFFYNIDSQKFQFIPKKKFLLKSYLLCSVIYPNLNFKKFKNIIKFQSSILKIENNSSILDFGSGNGGFLYYFINKFRLNNNLSLEVSRPLILFQKEFIKKTFFFITNHNKINYTKKLRKKFIDYSFCNSVFQYFIDNNYAENVIEFLIRQTRKNILIYDIKNFDTKNKYINQVRKRQKLTVNEFKKKYENTPIRFYKKKFFKNILQKLQSKYSFSYKFMNLPKDATDFKFGYCLIIYKK